VIKHAAKMAVERAQAHKPGVDNLTWGLFVKHAAQGLSVTGAAETTQKAESVVEKAPAAVKKTAPAVEKAKPVAEKAAPAADTKEAPVAKVEEAPKAGKKTRKK